MMLLHVWVEPLEKQCLSTGKLIVFGPALKWLFPLSALSVLTFRRSYQMKQWRDLFYRETLLEEYCPAILIVFGALTTLCYQNCCTFHVVGGLPDYCNGEIR
jgi:hypothetical protein